MQDEKAELCNCPSADACPCYSLIKPAVSYTGGCRRQIQVGEPFHYGTPSQVDRLEAEAFKNSDLDILVQRDVVFIDEFDDVGILARSVNDAQKMAEKVADAVNEHSFYTAKVISRSPVRPAAPEPAEHQKDADIRN